MAPVVYFVLPADDVLVDSPSSSTIAAALTEDSITLALGVTRLVLFNIAWNQARIVGWPTPYVYVLLIIGVLLLCAFVFVEGRVTAPLVPRDIWTRPIGLMLRCIEFGWSSFGIWNFHGTRFHVQIRGQPLLVVVAQYIVGGLSGIAATLLTGFLLPKIGPSVVMVFALAAFCGANALYTFAPVQQTFWAMTFVSLIVAPFGMDMSFPAASLVASNSVPRHQQGIAASLVNTFVNYAVSLGLGFAGTVEAQLNHGGKTKADVLAGYRDAFYLGMGFSALGIVTALLNLALDIRKDRRMRTLTAEGETKER